MGRAKAMMMEEEEKLAAATEIAIEAGLLERCPYHEYVLDKGDIDYTDAYKHGNALMSQGEWPASSFDDRREMTDKIKEAIESAGELCPGCEKIKRE